MASNEEMFPFDGIIMMVEAMASTGLVFVQSRFTHLVFQGLNKRLPLADDIFTCILLTKNVCVLINILL